MSFDAKAIRMGVLASSADVLGRQGAQFVVAIVLARLLTPNDFGLIATVLFFAGLASLFVDGGFGSALIWKQDSSKIDESTVFWFNIGSATLLALILIAAAPLISAFYDQPILQPLVWAMACNIWLSGWAAVHRALIAKKLVFHIQMQASLFSILVSGSAAIYLAASGWGVWALAFQSVLVSLLETSALWYLHAWRPMMVFRWENLRQLFAFGAPLTLSSLLAVIASQIHIVLIGRTFSMADLGLFSRAETTRTFPQSLLSAVYSQVAFSTFASLSSDLGRFRRGLEKSITMMMAVNLPVMVGLAATAHNVLDVLFGSNWAQAAPILVLLCVAGAFWPLQVANIEALKGLGRSDLVLRVSIVKNSILLACVVAACFWSMTAIAAAISITGILTVFLLSRKLQATLSLFGFVEQLRLIWPYALSAVAMGLLVVWIDQLTGEFGSAVRLVVQVSVGACVYAGLISLFRLPAIGHYKNILQK